MALTVFGGAHRLVLKLRVAQLAGDAFFIHPVEQRLQERLLKAWLMAITYLPSRVGRLQRRQAAGTWRPVWRYMVSPKYIQWGTAPSVPMAQASWIATSMYWPWPDVRRSNSATVMACSTNACAHVPGLIALATNRRDGRIGIPCARHGAAQREMRGIVHLQIAPRSILPEVGE